MSDSDDDSPQLSAHTLAALQDFYKEQTEIENHLQRAQESGDVAGLKLEENWQLSQFWYSEETALKLAQEALAVAGENGRIACISAPTAYKKIREIKPSSCDVKCLEYDERFKVFGEDFQFYDYKEPLDLPLDLKQSFDIIIADPPFLSEECLCKTAVTVKFLAKEKILLCTADPPFLSEECLCKTAVTVKFMAKEKILLCTGAVMEELAYKLLGVRPCQFQPKHDNQLQNEFKCYTNYHSEFMNSR